MRLRRPKPGGGALASRARPCRTGLVRGALPSRLSSPGGDARGDRRFDGLADLTASPPRKVGVLGGSSAETWLRGRFSRGEVEIVSYDGNTNAMSEVVTSKLDATLQDLPIALFYRKDFPSLRFAGAPVAPGRYVIYLRKDDAALRALLDRAIATLRATG